MDFTKKSAAPWFSPSFSDQFHDNVTSVSEPALKRERFKRPIHHDKRQPAFSKKKVLHSEEVPWIEKFMPNTKDELAVHKKKVSEVETWLQENAQKCLNKTNKKAPILILSGPTGAGKTATVQALCKDLKLEVHEWANSQHVNYWKSQSEGLYSFNDMKDAYQSQASLFSSFLLRANKYSLFNHQQKIVLVEDIPNIFLRDPSQFHNILRKYYESAKCPVIFIISDDTKGESTVTRLLPKLLQSELNILNISFNPVSPMMLMKILNKINNSINVEESSHTKLVKSQLDEIASDSAGDIRNAVNALQFFTMSRDKILKPKPQVCKRKTSDSIEISEDDSASSNTRDCSLFLFHALGKILYSKRRTSSQEQKHLPNHMKHLERIPLVADPEDVYKRTSISAEGFSLFLHQNYISFIDDINVAAECSFWLSQSEILHVHWQDRDLMNDYAASITARGLMFNLVPTDSGNRWRPLHKPQYYGNRKSTSNMNDVLRNAFQEKSTNMRELQTEFVPFLYKIGANKLRYDQQEVTAKLGEMSTKNTSRTQLESISAKDAFELDMNENTTDQSHLTLHEDIPLSRDQDIVDEEIVIEDYNF